jgi:adenylate cyclase
MPWTCIVDARRYEDALAEVENALVISPNLASAHGIFGGTLIFSGYPKEGSCRASERHQARRAVWGQCEPSRIWASISAANMKLLSRRRKELSRSAAGLPLACRGARPGRPDRRSERGAGEGHSDCAGLLRPLCPPARVEDHAHTLEGLRKAG